MKRTTVSERALVLAPRGRDAAIAVGMLSEAGIEATVCAALSDLLAELDRGAALVVVTEEAIASADLHPLSAWLADQEEWSDLPFILLTQRGGGLERNPAARRHLELLGNVTFLERPFHPTTLVSLARSALRGRRRQYEARTRLLALHESEARYRTLFEAIDAGFCIIEMIFDAGRPVDYRFVEVNPAFQAQTGLTEVVGRRMRDLAPAHEQHWFDAYGRVATTGEPVRFESEAAALGRWYDVHAFRIGAADEPRVAVLFNDISARRRSELALREINETLERRVAETVAEREAATAQLHEAQKLETLGQLTGGVAHDINNLLTPITGALDLLARKYGESDPRAARLIDGALQSAERARLLVSRLLGFARRQALETRAVDLAAVIDGMRDLLASSVGGAVELHVVSAPDLPPALADPNQLELALLNLCVNARDAMPGGGSITITTERALVGPGGPASLKPGAYVRLSVVDTGIGMDAATLARAVEPFYSTKELGRGTGLGLSMVHGLAAQLGGAFILASQPGEGTRADLYLPVAKTSADPLRPAVPARIASVRPLSLLLVDDEELVRTGAAEMMRDLGHTVHEAASGKEALAKLRAGLSVAAVVTDYMMPQMNGAELARQVRTLSPELPVLVVTGYAGGELNLGLPQLAKPFRQADLAASLAQLVGGETDNMVRLGGRS